MVQPDNKPVIDPTILYELIEELFDRYVECHQLDCDEIQSTRIREFVGWCEENNLPVDAKEEYMDELNIPEDVVDYLGEVLANPWDAMAHIYPHWRRLISRHRPPLANPIHFCHVAFTLGFKDQKVTQITCPTEFQPGKIIGEGFIISLMQDQARQILDTFAFHGFDACHDEYGYEVADDPADLVGQSPPPPPDPGAIGDI